MYFNFFQKCSGGERFVFDEAIFHAYKAMLLYSNKLFSKDIFKAMIWSVFFQLKTESNEDFGGKFQGVLTQSFEV